ncbi:sterol desaturase family protein [Alteromonas oceanisediminis]|uniref:sterol desaturase family protein n=1 Tax=Alteromonas oceanisediminis TaxID=2836180 RepID=UPI001BD9B107|nr:sterol desaturase family protein [Alteromonas oceanisediminis]MBT0586301.1 sterol desaturase family protein [Alteromonas oceanisediminis]
MKEQLEKWGHIVYASAESGQLFTVLLIAYLIMIAVERMLYIWLRPNQYNNKDGLYSMGVSTITAIAEAIIFGALYIAIYLFVYENFRLFTMPNVWWAWVAIFLLHDFAYYVDHYISHRVGFFWAFHHVHHSSNEINITTAARGFFLGQLAQPAYLLLPLLGVDLIQLAIVATLKNVWGIFNHTRLVTKMGWLERFLCTPSVHRVHHGTQRKYIDKNYGQVLSLWDKLFGTFQEEEEEPRYGLVTPLKTYNPFKAHVAGVSGLYQKMRLAPTFTDKLKYLYKPPGWDHITQRELGKHRPSADDVKT